MSNQHDRKVALITGANKGIGFETARQLVFDHGMTVLIAARDEARGREAAEKLGKDGADARPLVLDVTDPTTAEAAAHQVEGWFGRLDVLVNNAGIALDRSSPSQIDIDVLRRTYETNVFGVFNVTKAMLPLLKKSGASRVVNVSSGLGSLAQNSDPDWEFAAIKLLAYNSSKAALNMMTIVFAAEFKDSAIKINATDPGYTATDLNNHQGTQTVAQGATAAVRLATLPDDGPTGGFFNEDGVVPW